MDIKIIRNALVSALSLLNNEVGSIEFNELKDDYLSVIVQLEISLKEINKNE